jgi:hypothetical protein
MVFYKFFFSCKPPRSFLCVSKCRHGEFLGDEIGQKWFFFYLFTYARRARTWNSRRNACSVERNCDFHRLVAVEYHGDWMKRIDEGSVAYCAAGPERPGERETWRKGIACLCRDNGGDFTAIYVKQENRRETGRIWRDRDAHVWLKMDLVVCRRDW